MQTFYDLLYNGYLDEFVWFFLHLIYSLKLMMKQFYYIILCNIIIDFTVKLNGKETVNRCCF